MGLEYKSFLSANSEFNVKTTLFWRGYSFDVVLPKNDSMKYIGIDRDGEVYVYQIKPERNKSVYSPPRGCRPDYNGFTAIGYFEEVLGETLNIKNWRDIKYCKKYDLEKSTEIRFDH